MCVMVTTPYRGHETATSKSRAWLSFAAQIGLVAAVELTDELIRGMIAQSNPHIGQANALHVVQFEAAHGFWVEPAWQEFFEQSHHLLGLAITWPRVVAVVNTIYLFGHIFATLFFAIWIFLFRRQVFAFLRNIFFFTNALALVLYETFPLAPPRLTTGLRYAGHPVKFVDTMYQVLKGGKVAGTQFGYNEFAAMPSLHIGWALLVGAGLIWTLRPLPLRLLVPVYPLLMVVTVVVTGNHYLMDGVGALGIVILAIILTLLLQWWRDRPLSLRAMFQMLQERRHRPTVPIWRSGKSAGIPHTGAA